MKPSSTARNRTAPSDVPTSPPPSRTRLEGIVDAERYLARARSSERDAARLLVHLLVASDSDAEERFLRGLLAVALDGSEVAS